MLFIGGIRCLEGASLVTTTKEWTMTERIDDLEKYYSPIEIFDKLAETLFWASAFLSVLILYSSTIKCALLYESLDSYVSVAFIILVVLHSIFVHCNSFYLIPKAENMRRKQLLSDAFGIPLTPEQTKLYYNNEISPSAIKLGVNVLENAFFAKNVCGEMAKKQRVKILIYSIVWFVALSSRSTNLGLILTLTQALFSSEIIFRWIKIEVLRSKNELVYDSLYNLFLNRGNSEDKNILAGILDSFASYESAKASASLKQSSKVFHKLNPILSEEWKRILGQLDFQNAKKKS